MRSLLLLPALLVVASLPAQAQTASPYDALREAGVSPADAAALADLNEDAFLRASNAGADDRFGVSVSVSGDRIVVGAWSEDGPTNGTRNAGAAYVYDRTGSAWAETAVLRASNAGADDYFGAAVAVSGDRVVVGAPGVDGPTPSTITAGAVYVFDLAGGAWTETAILSASNAGGGDSFGSSVSVSGARVVVGAWSQDDPPISTLDAGAAYVYDLTHGAWTETAILRASNRGRNDWFGRSVSVSGDRVVVGAPNESGPANGTPNAGAAYVFDRTGSAWTETAVLRASNPDADDNFSWSVSVSGDRVVVGAWSEDGPTNGTPNAGAAYVYDFVGGAWTETVVLRASNPGVEDWFGRSVSVSGDRVGIGAYNEDGPTDGASNAGAAYVYDFVGGVWAETAILRASNAAEGDLLGTSVWVSGDRAVVGAGGKGDPRIGTENAGAAYVYDLVPPPLPTGFAFTAPTAGAAYRAGDRLKPMWTTSPAGAQGTVTVTLRKAGAPVDTLYSGPNLEDDGDPSTPGPFGAVRYTIPLTTAGGTDYTVHITLDVDPAVAAESGAFTITAVPFVVTAPAGDETFDAGETTTVTFSAPRLTSPATARVYLRHRGQAGSTLLARETATDGAVEVTLPADTPAASDYFVLVRLSDGTTTLTGKSRLFSVTGTPAPADVPQPTHFVVPASTESREVREGYLQVATAGLAGEIGVFAGGVLVGAALVTGPAAEVVVLGDALDDGAPLSLRLFDGTERALGTASAVVFADGEETAVALKGDAPTSALTTLTVHVSPNPAATSVTVRVTAEAAQPVSVVLHDVLGRAVATAFAGGADDGVTAVVVSTASLPAGVYVVRVATGGQRATTRLTVAR